LKLNLEDSNLLEYYALLTTTASPPKLAFCHPYHPYLCNMPIYSCRATVHVLFGSEDEDTVIPKNFKKFLAMNMV